MTHRKTKRDEEWRAFAGGVNCLRSELQALLVRYQGLLPARLVDRHLRIVRDVDSFRASAEDWMFSRGGPRDTRIWHPGTKSSKGRASENLSAGKQIEKDDVT